MKKSSVFVALLLSYLGMLLVALVIGLTTHEIYSKILQKQTEKYNHAMLLQVKSVLDGSIQSVMQSTMDIQTDSAIRNILSTGETVDGIDRYNFYLANQLLENTMQMNHSIENIYIYIKRKNMIISNHSVYSPEEFYNNSLQYQSWDFEKWEDMISGTYFMQYEPEQLVTDNGEQRYVITQLLSLPLGINDGSQGMLVISISSSELKDPLKEINISSMGAILVMDTQNNVILGTGDTQLLNLAKKYRFTGPGTVVTRLNGLDVILTDVDSSVNSWHYVSVISEKQYMNSVNIARNITFALILGLMLIGIVMAFLLARKTFNPIRNTVKTFKEQMPAEYGVMGVRNEYDYIDSVAKRAFKNNAELKATLEKQMPVIRANMMMRLLKGDWPEDTKEYGQLEKMGIAFKYGCFAVWIIQINQFFDDSFHERSLIKFAIGNILQYSLDRDCVIYPVDMDLNQLAVIINLQEKDTRQIFQCTGERIILFVREQFTTEITISVGTTQDSIEQLSLSYHQALQTMDYQLLKGEKITFYENTIFPETVYSYTIETEMQIINSIKLGNYKRVEQILDQTYQQNFIEKRLSQKMIRCLFFDIMSTGFKSLSSSGVDYEKIFGDSDNPYERIMSCKNAKEMQTTLKFVFQKICGYIDNKLKSKSTVLIDQIHEYIRQHFRDPNIGLESISNAFHLNSNYLSSLFKEQTGENFIVFINALRIDAAKKLLLGTDDSLQLVAEEVGYSNSNVLIRNFKKHEGITPGEFRKKSEKK